MRPTKPLGQATSNPRNTYIPKLCPDLLTEPTHLVMVSRMASEVSDAFGPYGVNKFSFTFRHQLEAEAIL